MSVESLLETYGYPFLFVGTVLEGETPLLMASFLAHRGYLAVPMVIAVAFVGAIVGDQFFFYLGRTRGPAMLAKRPAWRAKADRVRGLFDRYGLGLVVSIRFLYGLRVVSPFVLGMSGYSFSRFLVLDVIGAAVWATVFAVFGYAVAGLLHLLLGNLREYEVPILVGMAVVSAIAWLLHYRARRAVPSDPESGG